MPILDMIFRLPGAVAMQRGALPDLRLEIGGRTLTISEPFGDATLSTGRAVPGSRGGYGPRWGDLMRVTVVPVEIEEFDAANPTDVSVYKSVLPEVQPILQRFLGWLRVETRQVWLGTTPAPMGWYRHALRYGVRDDAGELVAGQSGSTADPAVDQTMWLTTERWQTIGDMVSQGQDPPLPRELLAEATAHRLSGSVRAAVLNLAMACEVAMKTFVREVGGVKDPLYAFVVDKDRELSIFEYLDNVLLALTGVQLKQTFGGEAHGVSYTYNDLKRLFEARNKVAHEGRAYWRTNKGQEQAVDIPQLRKLEMASRALVAWLDAQRGARLADTDRDNTGTSGSARASASSDGQPAVQ